MKRSEMKDKLWESSWLSGEWPDELKDAITNELLKIIEDAGMMPPLSHDGLDDDFGNEIHGPLYNWEPEDGD